MEYRPDPCQNTVVEYTIAEPGQHGTMNQPALEPMIDIDNIIRDGVPVPPWDFDKLAPIYEREIIDFLMEIFHGRQI